MVAHKIAHPSHDASQKIQDLEADPDVCVIALEAGLEVAHRREGQVTRVQHLERKLGATLVASGTAADRIEGAAYRVPVPTPTPALLSPLLSVVPGQLFAWALARARGLDPDAPHGLAKVTLAR